MNTQQIADKLVSMCRQAQNMEAIAELYADNCTSREMPGMPNEFTEGKSAITKKSEGWYASVEEFHSSEVGDPIVAGNHFSCVMKFDCTFKGQGRMAMEEISVYEVKDSKIVAEQFFYSMPG